MESLANSNLNAGKYDVWVRYVKKGQNITELFGKDYKIPGPKEIKVEANIFESVPFIAALSVGILTLIICIVVYCVYSYLEAELEDKMSKVEMMDKSARRASRRGSNSS